MAHAIARDADLGTDDTGTSVTMQVAYAGPDVPGGRQTASVSCYFAEGDTEIVARSKATDAVVQTAADRGYVVNKNNILFLMGFVRGV